MQVETQKTVQFYMFLKQSFAIVSNHQQFLSKHYFVKTKNTSSSFGETPVPVRSYGAGALLIARAL